MFEKRISLNRPNLGLKLAKLSDGTIKDLGIEQFPVQSCNYNQFGFPKNDVTLLLEVSRKSGVDSSRFEAIASRLNAITPKDNRSKKLDDLWKDWKPASLQSPSEIAAFEEYWFNKYGVDSDVQAAAKTVKDTVKEPVSDSDTTDS